MVNKKAFKWMKDPRRIRRNYRSRWECSRRFYDYMLEQHRKNITSNPCFVDMYERLLINFNIDESSLRGKPVIEWQSVKIADICDKDNDVVGFMVKQEVEHIKESKQ